MQGREGPRPGLLGSAAHGAGWARVWARAGPAAGAARLMAERPQVATWLLLAQGRARPGAQGLRARGRGAATGEAQGRRWRRTGSQ
jgi:hypothetical protein